MVWIECAMQDESQSKKEEQCMMPNTIGSTYMQDAARCVFSRALRYHAAILDAWPMKKGVGTWDEEVMKEKLMTVNSRQVQKHRTYNVIYVRVSMLF